MTVSDLLTLIGILLAVFAFIAERNREYIFLKLSNVHLSILVFIFFYVHFLLSFDWWCNKFEWLNKFKIEGFPTAEVWAYILSSTALIWAVWLIFFGKFPLSRRKKLMSYYQKLILRNDTAFLAQLIENNHLIDVIDYLRAKKSITIANPTGVWQIDHQAYLKEFSKKINTRSLKYGNSVYYDIILSDSFIENVANINPYLFATIIGELNDPELKDDQFVNKFLKVLTANKNGNFFREIRNNQNLGELEAYVIEEERPILFALFSNINVCSINQAWRGVGEQAILEMHEESKKEYSALRESDREQDKDTIWTYRITNAIWYFDIMVRQAIKQDVNDHMWMYYYRHFLTAILTNMEKLPFPESDQNYHSRNFDLIQEIFSKMMDWKKVVINSKNSKLLSSISDLEGQCIYEVSISDKLRMEDKLHLINWSWENTIESWGNDERQNEIVEELVSAAFEKFRRPSTLFSPTLEYRPQESEAYLQVLNNLWEERDIPKLHGISGERANRFKTEVIDALIT